MDIQKMTEIAEEVSAEAVRKHVQDNIYFGHIFAAIFLLIQAAMFLTLLKIR